MKLSKMIDRIIKLELSIYKYSKQWDLDFKSKELARLRLLKDNMNALLSNDLVIELAQDMRII